MQEKPRLLALATGLMEQDTRGHAWVKSLSSDEVRCPTAHAFAWLTLRPTFPLILATCLLPLAGLAVSTRSGAAWQLSNPVGVLS